MGSQRGVLIGQMEARVREWDEVDHSKIAEACGRVQKNTMGQLQQQELHEYESHCHEKVIREEWLRNELQSQVTMLNARFKKFELQVLWPLALVQFCRGREISHGEKDGDTGMVSTEGEKGSPQERELVGPGTEVSSIASKRQHAGGGEVTELTQDATVVTAHTDAISEFHSMTQNYALFTPRLQIQCPPLA